MTTSGLIVSLIIHYTLAQDSSEIPPNKENENVVTVLDLSSKDITTTSLHDYDFSKYPSLEDLDLSNNEIEHIPTETFSKNSKLKKLNLSGNTKLQLPKYYTLLTATIEELNLSNCNIEELPLNIFDGLIHLKAVDLSNNPLDEAEAIQVSTLVNLFSLQKITLPHIDEVMIESICKEVNIVIEVNHEDSTDSVKCTDVNAGSWQMEIKEKPEHKFDEPQTENEPEPQNHEDTEQKHADEDLATNENEYPEEDGETLNSESAGIQTHLDLENESSRIEADATDNSADSANKENKKRQANSNETDGTQTSETDADQPHAEEPSNTDDVAPTEPVPEDAENENPEDNPNPDSINDEIKPEDNEPNGDAATDNEEPTEAAIIEDAEKSVENTDTNTNNHDSETPAAENEDSVPPEEPVDLAASTDLNIPDTTITPEQQEVPDTIDGFLNPSLAGKQEESQATDLPPTEEQDSTQAAAPARPPMQRGVVNVPPNTDGTEVKNAASPENKSEKIQENKEGGGDTKAANSTNSDSGSTGTNILIFLVIAVVVAGAAAFAYKFYKTRTYQAARTSEPVDRELKEIVVDRKANGPNKDGAIVEHEPLMEKRGNSVEIKEIDETNEAQPQALKGVMENSELPNATPNETIANNQSKSGPYMPTTTPIKPGADSKGDDSTQK